MADTITKPVEMVVGNKRQIAGVITAGGGAVATGLQYVDVCTLGRMASHTSGGAKTVLINTAASGAGDIEISSATAGDDHYFIAIGN